MVVNKLHKLMLRWITQQIPLLECETSPRHMPTDVANNGSRQTRPKRGRIEENFQPGSSPLRHEGNERREPVLIDNERPAKRTKCYGPESRVNVTTPTASTVAKATAIINSRIAPNRKCRKCFTGRS